VVLSSYAAPFLSYGDLLVESRQFTHTPVFSVFGRDVPFEFLKKLYKSRVVFEDDTENCVILASF